jgi:hypothetical protein
MATATPPRTRIDLAEAQVKVRHPLQRLRGAIRAYVAIEGATTLFLYLSLWFWIALVLDYGVFKAFTLDWVQVDNHRVLRIIALVGALGGLAAVLILTVALRLFRDFRDAALALVLERRFPKVLGDRLITAVELADTRKAAKYGYSQIMIEQTIQDAAERVETVPVNDVFRWNRLVWRGVLVGVLTLGLYLVAGLTFCLADSLSTGSNTGLAGFGQFHDVSAQLFERDIMLGNIIWPRRAFLEFKNFDEAEIKIGSDAPPPNIRLRAWKYVLAATKTTTDEGWRGVRLSDQKKLLGDEPVGPAQLADEWKARDFNLTDPVFIDLRNRMEAALSKAKGDTTDLKRERARAESAFSRLEPDPDSHNAAVVLWKAAADKLEQDPALWPKELPALTEALAKLEKEPGRLKPCNNLTLDEIDLLLDKTDTHSILKAEQEQALRDLLDRFDQMAANPEMKRTLRKLEIPDTVYVNYKSAKSKNTMTLKKEDGNEYVGTFTDLKESITFTARGLDYYTPTKQITVVPPPVIEEMNADLFVPAYRLYRPAQGERPEALKGLKQVLRNQGVSLQGGDKSTIQVPSGTDVVLEARTDKKLSETPNIFAGKANNKIDFSKHPVALQDDGRTFQVRFDDVRETHDFIFQFRDTDGVVAVRRVEIVPAPDKAPTVDLVVAVLRRGPQGFLITPDAIIPFDGKASDDVALTELQLAYTLTKLDKQAEQGGRALLMLSAAMLLPGGPGQELATAASVASLSKETKVIDANAGDKEIRRAPVLGFYEKLQNRSGEFLPLKAILSRLDDGRTTPANLLKDFLLEQGDESTGFDLKNPKHMANSLKITGDREIQPEYVMHLWVEATDNDIETGPHKSQVKERLPFHIVSEEKLVLEIGKEEEQLYTKFKDVVDQVASGQDKLAKVQSGLNDPKPTYELFLGMSSEIEKLEQLLDKSQTPVNEVRTDYERIIKEMKTNRVQQAVLQPRERDILGNLTAAKDQDCPAAIKAMGDLRAALDAVKKGDSPSELANKATAARTAFDQARVAYTSYQQRLFEALEHMQQMMDIQALRKILQDILDAESKNLNQIEKLRQDIQERILGLDEPPKKDK